MTAAVLTIEIKLMCFNDKSRKINVALGIK
jgi:hypothetical protein